MRSGIVVPNFGPLADVRLLASLAAEAERAGWDGFFVWDHINLGEEAPGPMVDPWVALTAVALATTELRFGTFVTPLPRRRPWKLARETTTLDRLSGGRLILGVGLGSPGWEEFGAFGEPTDARERALLLDEGLDVLQGLWSGEEFSYRGEVHRLKGVRFRPTPVQRPRIPIWTAGWWPHKRPFRRAARLDGVAPERVGGETPSAAEVREIRAYVAEHRAGDEPFDIVLNGRSADGTSPAELAAAGATWWLERVDDPSVGPDAARELVRAGP